MKILLLSDTHGFLDEKIHEYLNDRDEVWHAGDIGSGEVADALESASKLRAVFGNIDDLTLQKRFPLHNHFVCEGLNVWITHIAGNPPHFDPRIKKELMSQPPDLFISGHSHILKITRHKEWDNMIYINPGAAGNHGFHIERTMVRFDVEKGLIQDMEVIQLGKRGYLPKV